MAQGVPFEGANTVFHAPEGEDRVLPLHIFHNGSAMTSCWELTEEEIDEINNTGRIFVSVFGRALPPIFVGGELETRALLVDFGKPLPRQNKENHE